ncbi:hypothetical protein PGB28_21135 [Primorskyibacter aestuariivivens]|nr:hypothetical protein [Primorskyibacter aestuariivivens]MDA7430962.1 hypothetical protein [Primorskyibacter aestuariivivens]
MTTKPNKDQSGCSEGTSGVRQRFAGGDNALPHRCFPGATYQLLSK